MKYIDGTTTTQAIGGLIGQLDIACRYDQIWPIQWKENRLRILKHPLEKFLPILVYEIYAIKVSQNLTMKTSKTACLLLINLPYVVSNVFPRYFNLFHSAANKFYDSLPPSVTKLPRSVTHHDPVYGFGNVI